MRVLYRADGGTAIGTGHILRGLRIAEAMRGLGPVEFIFLSRPDAWALERIRQEGLRVEQLSGDELDALLEAARRLEPDLIALDRLETEAALTRPLRELGRPLVTFDDVGLGRLFCRALINTLEEEADPAGLAAAGVALYQGPAYAVLPAGYESAPWPRRINDEVGTILVTMGGGDPLGLSVKAARAVGSLMDAPAPPPFAGEGGVGGTVPRRVGAFSPPPQSSPIKGEDGGHPDTCKAFTRLRATVVAGGASPWLDELREIARLSGARITVKPTVPRLLEEFVEADLALVAGGLTMHEALATGTPVIAVCQQVRHQAEMAARFEAQGAMVSLGPGQDLSETEIARAVASLAADLPRRQALSRRGQELVDGRGTQRVAGVFARFE